MTPDVGNSGSSLALPFAAVLRRAQAGDRGALEVLLERFYPRVQRAVHRRLERDFRAHHRWIAPLFSTGDVVQEVFLGIVRSLHQLAGSDEDSFVRYLTCAVRNRLVDAIRHHGAAVRDARRDREPPAEDPPDRSNPVLALAVAERDALYRAIVGTLAIRQQRLIELRWEDGLDFARIARILAFPTADAARKAHAKARALLLARLQRAGLGSG
jgi:RNA polymerase sigma factor (sigma-70 family)